MNWIPKLSKSVTQMLGGALIVVALNACSDGGVSGPSQEDLAASAALVRLPPLASIRVTPVTGTAPIGGTLQLTASPLDASGAPRPMSITWSSSNASVGTVSATGLVRGLTLGTITISANHEHIVGTASVTITAGPVATVSVSPTAVNLVAGAQAQLTATSKDAAGNVSGATMAWSSSNVAIATVSTAGLVIAKAAGSTTITATSNGKSASAAVAVTAPALASIASIGVTPASNALIVGATAQLTATPKDSAGNALTGRTMTWTSSNVAIATVSTAGLVAAKVAGSATITATSGGKSGSATVTVTATAPASIATITVTPASNALTVGTTAQLTATPKDSVGNVLTGRTMTWTSSNTAVVTVTSSGLVSAGSAGSATITATSGTRSGTATVTATATAGGGTGAIDVFGNARFDNGTAVGDMGGTILNDYGRPITNVETPTGSRRWVYDVTNPFQGSGAIRLDLPASTGNQSYDANVPAFAPRSSGYFSFAYRQDATFDNSSPIKVMRFGGANGALLVTLNFNGDGPNKLTMHTETSTGNKSANTNLSSLPTPNSLRGNWHWYEVYVEVIDATHMTYKLWIDGVLYFDYVNLVTGPRTTSLLLTRAYFGATFNRLANAGSVWYDHIRVSSARIPTP